MSGFAVILKKKKEKKEKRSGYNSCSKTYSLSIDHASNEIKLGIKDHVNVIIQEEEQIHNRVKV